MAPRKTVAIALLAAALIAGCGSSGPPRVSPAAYVRAVCSGVAPFEQDVVSRSSALDTATFNNPVQSKNALIAFLQAVADDAGGALSKLRGAGTPDVPNGKAIQHAVVEAFTRVESTMLAASTRARALPTSSATALRNGARQLGANVRDSLLSFPSLSSAALRSPQIDQAAAREPACQSIASG